MRRVVELKLEQCELQQLELRRSAEHGHPVEGLFDGDGLALHSAVVEQQQLNTGGAIGSETEHETAPPRIPGNRVAASVIIGLIAIFVIGGILIKSSGTTNVNEGSRLVVVPTDATRTVVVPPCATGAKVTSHDEKAVIATTGSTAVSLPQGEGTRLVVVPPCTAATSNLPSAAFVLKPGTPVPTVKVGAESSSSSSSGSSSSSSSSSPLSTAGSPATVQSQLSVPPGSDVRSVVVPPCTHSKTPPQVILSAQGSETTTAVAPSC